jgi:hypothetical protein
MDFLAPEKTLKQTVLEPLTLAGANIEDIPRP